jgi:hypothetical protein
MKSFAIMLFFFLSLSAFAQADKLNVLKYFKGIEYYSDSTIKCAYNSKNGMEDGYAIEFDSVGRVSEIGKYKKGKKNGYWYTPGGIRWEYKNGESQIGAGDVEGEIKRQYRELYHQLLHLPF